VNAPGKQDLIGHRTRRAATLLRASLLPGPGYPIDWPADACVDDVLRIGFQAIERCPAGGVTDAVGLGPWLGWLMLTEPPHAAVRRTDAPAALRIIFLPMVTLGSSLMVSASCAMSRSESSREFTFAAHLEIANWPDRAEVAT
jgi:hypothetical protein